MKSIKLTTILAALMICAVSCDEQEEVWTPNDLNVSGITSYTALLGWGGIGDEFEVTLGDSVWIVSERSLEVKGLSPDADFRWQVRAIKDGTRSDWAEEHTFRTLPLPPKPSGLSVVASFKTAKFSWTGSEKKYEVKTGENVYEVSGTTYLAGGFEPATTYTWSVRSIRGVDASEWVQADFTTLERPAPPTNLAVKVSYTSATFTWSGGDPAYELKVGSNTYAVNGNEYTVNNLEPGTQYAWDVRASAGDGIYSNWGRGGTEPAGVESALKTKDALTAQITVNDLNVMRADVTITPGNGVAAYAVLVASKELYPLLVDIYGDGDEVAFVEIFMELTGGEPYETGAPITEIWNLNGSTSYEYYAVVLLYDSEGEPYPEVIKYEFTSPAYQEGLPEASASITVSDVTATSTRTVVMSEGPGAFGFYDMLYTREEYDEMMAGGEEDVRLDVAAWGYLYLAPEIDDWEWEGLDPGTEYVMVASPFNANGIEGYGDLVIKSFTTLSSSSGVSPKSKAYSERKKLKKALTTETVKLLDLKKKK
jgi:hypothetical protein